MARTYLLAMRCPVCRRRDSHSGSHMERENLLGDAKGKGTSGNNREAENTDASGRGGPSCSSDEAGVMPMERRGRATVSERVNLSHLARGGARISAEGGSLPAVVRAG